MRSSLPTGKSHLEFYRQHKIAPVSYNLQDMRAHLERRASLYFKLGLPPLAFRSARVLEVAAGLGHNSLYLAHTLPKTLVLLEPNSIGVDQIRAVYSTFAEKHTSPQVISCMLEDYQPDAPFDVVLCENWLGTSSHERSLLQKLGEMVAAQGALVITTVSPIGFVPNMLRRFLSVYAAPVHEPFTRRTQLLVEVFGSHLNTLKAMTRNPTDWVQDNMLNPAYFGLCLSIPQVLEQLGGHFEITGSSPSFAEDWRWFKGLHGSHRQFNQHFLLEYWRKAHNFLDCRESITVRDAALNMALEDRAFALLRAIELHEEAHMRGEGVAGCVQGVLVKLDAFLAFVPEHFTAALAGLHEIRSWMYSENFGKRLPDLAGFSALFGRETIYISLYREG